MKRIIVVLALIGCSAVFAHIGGKTPTEVKSVYCPSEINCTSNNLDSCTFNSIDAQYFGRPKASSANITGQHFFDTVRTSFHAPYFAQDENCYYDFNISLTLPIKPEANLEAYDRKQPPSSWIIPGVVCRNEKNPELCPLKENLGFVIHNTNISDNVFGSISGDVIRKFETKSYAKIIDMDILPYCSNEKVCTIDFRSKDQKYGSVKVDIDSMRIIEVSSLDPEKYQIHKVDQFNAVEITKMDKIEDAIYCPSEIICTGDTISSCSFKSPDEKYFEGITGFPKSGSWGFSMAVKLDQTCRYLNYLNLKIKPSMALEPYYTKPDSAWKDDRCENSANHCPFKHLDGVAIYNANVTGGIKAAIADKILPKILISPNASLGVTHNDVSPGCNGKKECIIDLLSGTNNIKYGSVKVDTDTMKVIETNSLYPTKIEISKIADSFNTIEIRYSY